MIRRHENSVSFKAAMLSISVHVALLIALLISVNWKTTHSVSVAEVELWDSVPSPSTAKPLPPPPVKEQPPEPPKPVEKVLPPEPKPEPKVEPKADITVKKEEPKKIEKKVEKKEPKKPDALAALQKQLLQDAQEKKPPKDDALKKLQQETLADARAESDNQAKAAKSTASAGEVDKYKAQIRAKIQRNVIKSVCGSGKPELTFDITVMPTGDVQATKLVKASGITACDEAVERAILQSSPLPLPADASLREQFRNLQLKFTPND